MNIFHVTSLHEMSESHDQSILILQQKNVYWKRKMLNICP